MEDRYTMQEVKALLAAYAVEHVAVKAGVVRVPTPHGDVRLWQRTDGVSLAPCMWPPLSWFVQPFVLTSHSELLDALTNLHVPMQPRRRPDVLDAFYPCRESNRSTV